MVETKQQSFDIPEWRPEVVKRRNQEAILEWHVRDYPPSAEEWDIITMGIRLSRHVGDWECEGCRLATQDHTWGWAFPTMVCLKDLHRIMKGRS